MKRAYRSQNSRRQRKVARRVARRRKQEQAKLQASKNGSMSVAQSMVSVHSLVNPAQRAFDEAEADLTLAQLEGSCRMSRSNVQSSMKAKSMGWLSQLIGRGPDAKARSGLMREMRVLSRLQHNNVCQLLGAVIEPGMEPLMVM